MDLSLLSAQTQPEPETFLESQTQDSENVPTSSLVKETDAPTDILPPENNEQSFFNPSMEDGEQNSITPLPSGNEASKCCSPCSGNSIYECTLPGLDLSEPSHSLLPKTTHDLESPHPTCSGFWTKPDFLLSVPAVQENTALQSTTPRNLLRPQSRPSTPLLRSMSPLLESSDSDVIQVPNLDLYIFESGSHEVTRGQTADPYEIMCSEFPPLTQAMEAKPNQGLDECSPVGNSEGILSQCPCGFSEERTVEGVVSEVMCDKGLRAPAANACERDLMSKTDGRSENVKSGWTPQMQPCDNPVELWLDACQYLTDEDSVDWEFSEKMSHSEIPTAHSAPKDSAVSRQETLVSDYIPDGDRTIGWSGNDTTGWGPSFERWPSVDSWASALSDLTGLVEVPPEDFTAAFAEIGAEIDALTQALDEVDTPQENLEYAGQGQFLQTMGVQDQLLNSPYIQVSSGQNFMSFCFEAEELELGNSDLQNVEYGHDPVSTTSREQKSEDLSGIQTEHSRGLGAQFSSVTFSTDSWSDDEAESGGYHTAVEPDGVNDDLIFLNITENTDLDDPPCVALKKPFTGGLLQFQDESCFFQPAVQIVIEEGNKLTPEGSFNAHSQLFSSLTDVDGKSSLHAHACCGTSSDVNGAAQVKPQQRSPESAMPSAPPDSNHSAGCQIFSYLEGDQSGTFYGEGHSCDHWTLSQSHNGIAEDSEAESTRENRKVPIKAAPGYSNAELYTNFAISADCVFISDEDRIAHVTLELKDSFVSGFPNTEQELIMPHKTPKSSSEGKTRSKKEKTTCHHNNNAQTPKKHEDRACVLTQEQNTIPSQEKVPSNEKSQAGFENKDDNQVIEGNVKAEKASSKAHGKKKKKHGQNASTKSRAESLPDVENGAKPKSAKGRIDMFEAKLGAKDEKAPKASNKSVSGEKKSKQGEAQELQGEIPCHLADQKLLQLQAITGQTNDDVIKRQHLGGRSFELVSGKVTSQNLKSEDLGQEKEKQALASQNKAFSEVVKQKTSAIKVPEVLQPIQAEPVSSDLQSLCLWCQFDTGGSDCTVTWSKDGAVLADIKRSAGDTSQVTLILSNASLKDLGMYECQLRSSHGSVLLHYQLTYEVLSEVVIPSSSKNASSAAVELSSEEEDAHCSKLLFKEDFLSDQYFGERHPISILTEKAHFGEGMHRRAFRTKLQAGQIPLLVPGHSCVLKVHNSLNYGTNSNDELVQKNFDLAVEECQVQNTAREYIKAYTTAAQSVEAFGDVPEIIPIYLVHRPLNDIPYATLEEELIGDFVKYSVKDGKEINLMRRDSEAGQKCCAFQHWVYQKTEGNLLVTDMQGVGMKLTDVGIATCKKGYKGFKGNCSTSFIDQFKALHQCNKFCEILGLKSMQPKPKRPAGVPKPKLPSSAAPKKKTFGATLKGKAPKEDSH